MRKFLRHTVFLWAQVYPLLFIFHFSFYCFSWKMIARNLIPWGGMQIGCHVPGRVLSALPEHSSMWEPLLSTNLSVDVGARLTEVCCWSVLKTDSREYQKAKIITSKGEIQGLVHQLTRREEHKVFSWQYISSSIQWQRDGLSKTLMAKNYAMSSDSCPWKTKKRYPVKKPVH
jgi:hypothetical protein